MDINNRIFHVRKDIAMTPVEEGECRRDRWWLVHPEKGIAFGISYSNSDKIGEPVWLCHKKMKSKWLLVIFSQTTILRVIALKILMLFICIKQKRN